MHGISLYIGKLERAIFMSILVCCITYSIYTIYPKDNPRVKLSVCLFIERLQATVK